MGREPLLATNGRVSVRYAQFYILDRHPAGLKALRSVDRSANRLIGTAPGAAQVLTGISAGEVYVTVEIYETQPDEPAEPWEETAVATYESPDGTARIVEWDNGVALGYPTLTANGPGTYKLRIHATGRTVARDLVVREDPTESYLLQIWPDTEGGRLK